MTGQVVVLGGDEQNLHGFHEGSNRAFLSDSLTGLLDGLDVLPTQLT